MSEIIHYKQVKFTKVNPDNTKSVDIVWIPSPEAIVGKTKDRYINNSWSSGWLIEEVYSSKLSDELDTERKVFKDFEYNLNRK